MYRRQKFEASKMPKLYRNLPENRNGSYEIEYPAEAMDEVKKQLLDSAQ